MRKRRILIIVVWGLIILGSAFVIWQLQSNNDSSNQSEVPTSVAEEPSATPVPVPLPDDVPSSPDGATPQHAYAEVVWRFLEVETLQDSAAYNAAVTPLVTAAYLPQLLRPAGMPVADMGGMTFTINRELSQAPGDTVTDDSGSRAYVKAFPYFERYRDGKQLSNAPDEPRQFTLILESGVWKIAGETTWSDT